MSGPQSVLGGEHAVRFYGRDEELSGYVGDYLGPELEAGGTAVVVATAGHRAAFDAELAGRGIDIYAARAEGRLRMADAAQTLRRFVAGRGLDPARFGTVVQDLTGGEPVRVYGEMVALLWEAGHVGLALELEELWNGQAERLPFSLLCAYPESLVAGEENAAALDGVCKLHAGVHRERGFPYVLDSVREARHFVVGVVESRYGPRVADDAAIVVTELAANAFQHAESAFRVAVGCSAEAIRISVRDNRPADGRPPAEPGHGLNLVEQIADSWGVELLADGKDVWARLPVVPGEQTGLPPDVPPGQVIRLPA